jgi:hypothetical protein
MAQLVVQLTGKAAAAFASGEGPAAPLRHALKELGVALERLHPGIDDDQLATYYAAELASAQAGAKVAERLQSVPGVTAAYVKPRIALP